MKDVKGVLGLATRARKVSSGDTMFHHLRSQKAYLIIMSEDIGSNSKKKILNKCAFYNIPYVYMDGVEMNEAMGTMNRKFIAVLDKGFAQKLHTCLKG